MITWMTALADGVLIGLAALWFVPAMIAGMLLHRLITRA